MVPEVFYSSDDDCIRREDIDETSRMSEEYFGTQTDSSQIPTTQETRAWIYEHAPKYLNIITSGRRIIGYAFILPCTKKLMKSFTEGKINEFTLFQEIKRAKFPDVPETLYLCASVLEKKFRGRGLATTAFVKTIKKITHNLREKPVLFYQKYSEEGRRLAERIAEITGLELRMRR